MKPEEIAPVSAPSGNFNRSYDPPAKHTEPSADKFKDHLKTDIVKAPQLDHIQINKLEATNNDSREIASEIRNVNQSLETIDSHLQQMRTSLENFVKIFPPYPPGSSERIEALRQFSTFRKMIDQIAQPGKANGLENILGDPARNSNSGDWTLRIGRPASRLVIRHQPVHTGPGGLDVPEIGADGSDQQISIAIDKATSALHTLNTRRRGFIADANRVISKIA